MKILLYYSAIIATFVWFSSFFTIKLRGTIIGIILFTPVVFYLWFLAIKEIKKREKKKPEIKTPKERKFL